MKNNLKLLFLLIFLLSGVYYVEEIYKKDNLKTNSKKLLNLDGNIISIKTPHYSLVKDGELWSFSKVEWRIENKTIELLLDIFSKFKYTKSLEQIDQSAFRDEVRVELITDKDHKYLFSIGKFSTITGRFYFKNLVTNQIYIALDDSFMDEVYSNELDLAGKKFLRLKALLNNRKYFFKRKIFDDEFLKRLVSLNFDSFRNKDFNLNLIDNTILPKAPVGIKTLNLKKNILQKLQRLEFINIYSNGKYVLGDKRSTLSFFDGNSKSSYSLFLSLNGKYGHFIRKRDSEVIFEVSKDDALFFLSSSQDFWNKRINYNINFKEVQKINFSLKLIEGNFHEFYIDDVEKFEVKAKDKNVRFISKVHMNFLFNLILNLTDFKQAKYITNEKEFSLASLTIKIFEKVLKIKVRGNEVLVFDQDLSLVYHYDNKTNQIDSKFFKELFDINER